MVHFKTSLTYPGQTVRPLFGSFLDRYSYLLATITVLWFHCSLWHSWIKSYVCCRSLMGMNDGVRTGYSLGEDTVITLAHRQICHKANKLNLQGGLQEAHGGGPSNKFTCSLERVGRGILYKHKNLQKLNHPCSCYSLNWTRSAI